MLISAIQKVRLLSNIDYYRSPVIELQKALYQFKDKYFKLKKYELILFPFYVLVIIPIAAKGMGSFDVLYAPTRYLIAVALAIGIGMPATVWIYKHLYEKKIKNASDFLNELSRFEEEN